MICPQRNKKPGALSWLGVHPDIAVVPFEDFLSDRQTQSFARTGRGIELVGNLERLGLLLPRDADTVVLDRIDGSAIDHATGHADLAGPFRVAILQRVVE